jgi:hypothetical protein
MKRFPLLGIRGIDRCHKGELEPGWDSRRRAGAAAVLDVRESAKVCRFRNSLARSPPEGVVRGPLANDREDAM